MSYDDSLPTNTDKARALIGDTSNNAATELLTDDHIDAVLALYTFNPGVAFLAEELAIRYAQKPGSVSLPGGLSVSWPTRVQMWKALAAQMRAGGVTGPAVVEPYAGGLTKTDKRVDEDNADRVAPAFQRDTGSDRKDTITPFRVVP